MFCQSFFIKEAVINEIGQRKAKEQRHVQYHDKKGKESAVSCLGKGKRGAVKGKRQDGVDKKEQQRLLFAFFRQMVLGHILDSFPKKGGVTRPLWFNRPGLLRPDGYKAQ